MAIERLHKNDRAVLKVITEKEADLKEVGKAANLSYDAAMRSAITLKEMGFAKIKEEKTGTLSLTEEGKRFLKEKFPEQRVAKKAELEPAVAKLTDEEKEIGLPWAIKNKWVKVKLGKITLQKMPEKYELYEALKKIEKREKVDKKIANILCERGNAERKISKTFFVSVTEKGIEERKKIKAEKKGKEIGEITPEIIATGKWREAKFTPYNVIAPAEKPIQGRPHPLSAFIQKIRKIFLSMGFEEMEGPEIESSFWNFDALFQPQDHPARELADTFYLEQPKFFEYPKELAKKVKEAHERSWKYEWSPDVAEQPVLRTHTTSVSARYLADIGKGKRKPSKYFCTGRVYRNESTDAQHLAEFNQVEGIVVWENANFKQLLGLMEGFYKQLGLETRAYPSYFPYTEPSLEVRYFDGKKWIEFAGAGIFRPEVSIPLWGKYPVLAWGMSLERPLMTLLHLKDMRKFYQNDLAWLRGD